MIVGLHPIIPAGSNEFNSTAVGKEVNGLIKYQHQEKN
jgi:hypothetical protein